MREKGLTGDMFDSNLESTTPGVRTSGREELVDQSKGVVTVV